MSDGQRIIRPEGWGTPKGYSDGIEARGRVIFISGQIGWNPATQQFDSDEFAGQVARALANISAVLEAAGASPSHVVRLTWFITSREAYLSARREMGEAYRAIFGRHYPAMSVVVVHQLLEPQALVEIEATAVVPD